jgi:hypothetical protein
MLCETHKDMVFKGAMRLLVLGGVALVAAGGVASRLPGPPAPLAAQSATDLSRPAAYTAFGRVLRGAAVHEAKKSAVGHLAKPAPARTHARTSHPRAAHPQAGQTAQAETVSASTARATISLYEHTTSQATLRDQGCEAAKRGVGGIVILDFGQPAYNGHTYGTYLFSGRFAGNAKITRAMLAYALGYRSCLPQGSTLSISLARGTSNYHPQVPNAYQAGSRWARETQKLERLLGRRGLAGHVTSAAADDVEPSWDRSFHRTRDFFRGYRSAGTGHVLYNFGSLDGGVGSVWNAKQIFYVASGMKYVAAIPEIYNHAMADQWAELAHIAKHRYHRPLKFAGVMTQHTSGNHAMKPRDAHKVLVRALASVGSGVAEVPPALTNIRSAE